MNRFSVFTIFLLLLLLHCAVRKAPSGGPEDRIPPEIIHTVPAPNSLNVSGIRTIEFQFNEWMNRQSVEKAIRSNLYTSRNLRMEWKGSKKLRIHLPDSLRPSTTYVFIIGSEARDAHGNFLARPYYLAFSTDSVMYQCSVSGRIGNPDKNRFPTIGLIRLQTAMEDSFWYTEKFEYFGTCDKDGFFRIPYVKPGLYRLLAYVDENYNERFDPYLEPFALFPQDAFLKSNGDSILNMNTYLTRMDTVLAKPDKIVVVKDKNALQLSFTKPIAISSVIVHLKDTVISPLWGPFPGDSKNYVIYLPVMIGKDSIHIRLYQSSGDSILRSYIPDSPVDSLPGAGISMSIQNPVYIEDTLFIHSKTPIPPTSFKNHFTVFLDGEVVETEIFWNDFLKIGFRPVGKWKTGRTYRIVLNAAECRDYWGQAVGDSLKEWKAEIITSDELGGVAGTIYTSYRYLSAVLTFRDIESSRIFRRQIQLQTGGNFRIEDLPAGKYVLRGFMDDGDGQWHPGSLMPFTLSEPVFFYPDTIRVRARWIKEGIRIE